jgi:hypothetical protein
MRRLLPATAAAAILGGFAGGALAGCGQRAVQKPAPPAANAPVTTRDARFKNDPNVPDHIKKQSAGERSGPAF